MTEINQQQPTPIRPVLGERAVFVCLDPNTNRLGWQRVNVQSTEAIGMLEIVLAQLRQEATEAEVAARVAAEVAKRVAEAEAEQTI